MRRSERGAALCNALWNGVHSARPLIRCVVRGWWGEGRISGRAKRGAGTEGDKVRGGRDKDNGNGATREGKERKEQRTEQGLRRSAAKVVVVR